jgi:hypothetical protein
VLANVAGELGSIEGSVLGYAQWFALRHWLPGLGRESWLLATIGGAIVAWGAGMAAGSARTGVAANAFVYCPARACVRSDGCGKDCVMWWLDLVAGFWNGFTAWIVLIAHVFGAWQEFPVYDLLKSGAWYDFGFLVGAGSPLLGAASTRRRGCSDTDNLERRPASQTA